MIAGKNKQMTYRKPNNSTHLEQHNLRGGSRVGVRNTAAERLRRDRAARRGERRRHGRATRGARQAVLATGAAGARGRGRRFAVRVVVAWRAGADVAGCSLGGVADLGGRAITRRRAPFPTAASIRVSCPAAQP